MAMIRCGAGEEEHNWTMPCQDLGLNELYLSLDTVIWGVFLAFLLGTVMGTPTLWRNRWRRMKEWWSK